MHNEILINEMSFIENTSVRKYSLIILNDGLTVFTKLHKRV